MPAARASAAVKTGVSAKTWIILSYFEDVISNNVTQEPKNINWGCLYYIDY